MKSRQPVTGRWTSEHDGIPDRWCFVLNGWMAPIDLIAAVARLTVQHYMIDHRQSGSDQHPDSRAGELIPTDGA